MKINLSQIIFGAGLLVASSVAMAAPPVELGALFTFSGTSSGYIYDQDIHSGVFRDVHGAPSGLGGSPLFSDSYVLQGGDPYGGDTGDNFEVSQAHGFATVAGFAIETGYNYGQPASQVGTFINANPDTGWLKFTNTTGSTFTGVLKLEGVAAGGIYGPAQFFSNSGSVTLSAGDSAYIVLNNESSNYGGYNHPEVVGVVPEPESYAMLLAGLGLLGFAARRRKQREVAAA